MTRAKILSLLVKIKEIGIFDLLAKYFLENIHIVQRYGTVSFHMLVSTSLMKSVVELVSTCLQLQVYLRQLALQCFL